MVELLIRQAEVVGDITDKVFFLFGNATVSIGNRQQIDDMPHNRVFCHGLSFLIMRAKLGNYIEFPKQKTKKAPKNFGAPLLL
jgi:hypothetical protein